MKKPYTYTVITLKNGTAEYTHVEVDEIVKAINKAGGKDYIVFDTFSENVSIKTMKTVDVFKSRTAIPIENIAKIKRIHP